jgi:hypothetical protein
MMVVRREGLVAPDLAPKKVTASALIVMNNQTVITVKK